jgi:hypothetical protein
MASGTGVYEVLLGRKQPKFGAEKIKNGWHLFGTDGEQHISTTPLNDPASSRAFRSHRACWANSDDFMALNGYPGHGFVNEWERECDADHAERDQRPAA